MEPTSIALGTVDSNARRALLGEWLRRPHVARWWGEAETALARDPGEVDGSGEAFILHGGRPVGYVRWQRVLRCDLDAAGLHEVPDDAVDIDILIGEAELTGRGIGPSALKLLLERLWRDPSIPLVGMSASAANERALRAYEKAGFRRRRRYDDPRWGPAWLMIAERTEGRPITSAGERLRKA